MDEDARASYREAVYGAFADRTIPTDRAVERALEVGTDRLGVSIGFFTTIRGGTQQIRVAVGDHEGLAVGNECPLSEAYCRRTIDLDGPLSIQQAGTAASISSAAYDRFGLETYIGCKVLLEGAVYGTICFADTQPRSQPFESHDETFVELVAQLTGQAVERERYEAELQARDEELEAQQRRLEAIAETSFDVLYALAADGTFEYVSPGVEQVLGYEPHELIGRHFGEFMDEVALADATEGFDRLLAGEHLHDVNVQFERADGTTVPLEFNGGPVIADGTVEAIQGVARDVSRRRERERELRLKNRVVDQSAIGVTIADATTDSLPIEYVNDTFCSMTGYDREATLGEPMFFFQGPATEQEPLEAIETASLDGRPITREFVGYRESGRPFWDQVTAMPIETERGALGHVVCFHRDVTEDKRTENLLDILNRVLRHNIRNDLTVVLGYARALTAQPEVDDGPITQLLEAGEDLMTSAENARDLEQFASRPIEPTLYEPASLLATLETEFEAAQDSLSIEVSVDADNQIVAGPQLERAIFELVENAIEHGGTGPTTVWLSASAVDDEVVVTVRDDGPGIDPSDAAVIDAGTETDLLHSLGLGLWIVDWIVTKYGGSFRIAPIDEPGTQGTIATLRLPAVPPGTPLSGIEIKPTTLFW